MEGKKRSRNQSTDPYKWVDKQSVSPHSNKSANEKTFKERNVESYFPLDVPFNGSLGCKLLFRLDI